MLSTHEIVTLEDALGLERKESVALYRQFVNPGLCTLFGVVGLDRRFVRAHGVTVVDDQGIEYLDFLGGYGALNLGHNHPEVVDAVRRVEEMPNILQASVGALVGPLGQALAAVSPGVLEKSFFCNSGAEAVEGALKLARISTGRTDLVYASGSFHGKSMGALSVTGREKYQAPFRPLVPGCHEVPFGDVGALSAVLEQHECAAFIVEPVQGEGGIIVPPDGYLKAAEEACHAHGALFIADEIQTGFGRTGSMFAVEHDDARPDIIATAKSLGGGIMPLGAYTATDDVWSAGYGSSDKCVLHTSTFGGNTRAMAAGLKAIEIVVRDELAVRARESGERLKAGVERIAADSGLIKEVRGRGLMVGVEFYEPKVAKSLSHEYLSSSIAALLLHDHHIITAYTLNNPNVIRFEPPLIVTDEQVDRVLEAFENVCAHHRGIVRAFAGLGRTMLTRRGH
ncbi:MAG: aspartate aminotransferase family protein [Anaerosomatales bacterium]|nr:aspartate aminotransferase family protein [Anaerosomatales bacterium]MDT8433992.1 aspartate aminotransferase family protein [Anaerosomatales bacterium]